MNAQWQRKNLSSCPKLLDHYSKAAIARALGIGANLLRRWCREANVDAEVPDGHEKVSPREYERTRRELAKVKTKRDILKKALDYFAAGLK